MDATLWLEQPQRQLGAASAGNGTSRRVTAPHDGRGSLLPIGGGQMIEATGALVGREVAPVVPCQPRRGGDPAFDWAAALRWRYFRLQGMMCEADDRPTVAPSPSLPTSCSSRPFIASSALCPMASIRPSVRPSFNFHLQIFPRPPSPSPSASQPSSSPLHISHINSLPHSNQHKQHTHARINLMGSDCRQQPSSLYCCCWCYCHYS